MSRISIQRNRSLLFLFPCAALLAAGALAFGGCQSVSNTGPAADAPKTAPPEMAGFFATYCFDCHDADMSQAEIDFATMLETEGHITGGDVLDRVIRVLAAGEMPPKRKKQPAPEERAALLDLLREEREARLAAIPPDPGRVTVRRLNRVEYNNTVRDLLGVESAPSDAFPPDDTGYGYDNIGDVLTLSPLLAEKYLDAAEQVAREVVAKEISDYGRTLPHQRKILVCNHARPDHGDDCAMRAIRYMTPRAYRRPAAREEIDKIAGFYQLARESGDSFEAGIELAVQALLVSPHFLFRAEEEKAPDNPDREYYVNNYEFASRLSYFLWSSMPDDELLACAQDGTIWNPRTLRAQVRRMLRDPRARALAENFGGQWLETRNLALADPDPDLFPEFTEELRLAMAEETTLFFDSIVTEDRSVLDFIGADYTFVNGPLAAHYGLDGIAGPAFQRVEVDPAVRGGILGQASILTLTSHPTRTSPVLRGVWILEKVLAAPTPDPPPGIPPLDAAPAEAGASLREKLEAHRADPSCASCHDRIDPLGFGLENYSPIGAWRAEESGRPVDNTGILPDGQEFAGPGELKKVLLAKKDDFTRALAENMLTYALGRGLEAYDRPAVESIVETVAQQDYRFSALVYEIVRSLPFKKQRGETDAS